MIPKMHSLMPAKTAKAGKGQRPKAFVVGWLAYSYQYRYRYESYFRETTLAFGA